jgi:hypothetical protein
VWGLGGGFAQQCAIAFGYPEIPNSTDPRWKYSTGKSNTIGAFAFDFLGNRGGDTLYSSAPPKGIDGEQNPNLQAVLPYPVPFLRETAFGKKLTTINPIQIDLARYDTMLTSIYQGRRERAPNARPQPGTYELIGRSVFPDGYDPNPELATWQPIAIARSIGSLSEAKVQGVTCAINNGVIGWYKKGTTLAGNGQPVLAPYELYFTGFPAELFYREQVRDLATIILETKGWNIWRGNCPPSAARLTLERQAELQHNLEKMGQAAARQFEQQGAGRMSAIPMTKRRR